MNGGFYIDCYFLFGPLKKIIIGNSNPLLDARIVDQYIQIRMILRDPVKKRLSLRATDRSQTLVMTEGNLSAVSFKTDSRLPQTITVLPSLINRSVNPRPMPEAPPVINILLLESFIEMLLTISDYILTPQPC
jgi:hypothetical protein